MIGRIISHYRIVEKLGEGGMGVVYAAEDTALKRTVALKFLPQHALTTEEDRRRFQREAQLAAALSHPNIAAIFEFDEFEGESFYAMEYVAGDTLARLMERAPLPIDRATEYAIAVADALSLAHRKGVIHRDIKPANIMVSPESAGARSAHVKVLDFGLAKLEGARAFTVTGAVMGTPAYMSPEQVRGDTVDHRTDIFSWGAVFYEMLAGVPPFRGEYEAAVLYQIVHEEPPPVSRQRRDVPGALEEIAMKSLAKDRGDRYQSMHEILADLASYEYRPETLATIAGAGRKSVVVLPFKNLSSSRKNQYLGDGIAEEISVALAGAKGLRVIARSSAMHYKDGIKDPQEIARELGIGYIVDGSIRRSGNALRVTARLVDAVRGSQVWAERFDGTMSGIFAFQEAVAGRVAGAIDSEFARPEGAGATKRVPRPEAYECYLEGKLLTDVPTPENLDRAITLFAQALRIEPRYANAYGRMSSAYLWFIDTGMRPDPAYLPKAAGAAERALEIDRNQPDAMNTLANLAMKRGDIERAFDGFTDVLCVDPNHSGARMFRGYLLLASSHFDEALREADRLLSIDPFWPLAHWLHSTIRLHQGIFDAAVAEYETVVATLPTKLVWLALAHRYAGDMEKAWNAARTVHDLEPNGILWPLTYGFLEGAEGRGREALRYLDERVRAACWDGIIEVYWVASQYATAGDRDEAFKWLERGIALGNRNYRWFAIDPNLANARDDPRFQGIMMRARSESGKLLLRIDVGMRES